MNYYYDLTLSFSDQKTDKFYEWELDDNLIEIKKIPLYRVNEKTIINILKYNGFINSSFLKKIKNRTVYKKNGKIKTILYATILTDSKFSVAIEFDSEGNILKRSYLLLEDELNTIEISYSLKKEKLVFNKISKRIVNNSFKQEEKMKAFIKNEIDLLHTKGDFDKLVYYYMEWFKEYCDNIDEIYTQMLKELENNNINKLDLIYNLVYKTAV